MDAERPKVTIGGKNYAVSKYSKHPDQAFDAALCLRNPENQLIAALEGGVPTIGHVYDEPEIDKAYPFKDEMLAELKNGAPRPMTPAYQNISTHRLGHAVAAGRDRPQKAADELRESIQDALDEGDAAVTATPTPAAAQAAEDRSTTAPPKPPASGSPRARRPSGSWAGCSARRPSSSWSR